MDEKEVALKVTNLKTHECTIDLTLENFDKTMARYVVIKDGCKS